MRLVIYYEKHSCLAGGTSAIAELARREGKRHPKAYVDWIKALEKEGDFQAMLQAAKEGLENVPKDYVVRSEIAQMFVRAGEHLGDRDFQLLGWREVFLSNPSLAHLLSLLSVAEQIGCSDEEIETGIARISSLLEKEKKTRTILSIGDHDTLKATASETLLNQAYLLSGRYEDAFNLCANKDALGWSYGHNPKGLALPFFLVLLSKGMNLYPTQNLKRLWDSAVNTTYCEYAPNGEEVISRFKRIMDGIFESIKLSDNEEKKYLQWCIREAGLRVDAIVGEKHRQSYYKAADLLVAVAEVLANRDTKPEGEALIGKYRQKYNRHSAFQHELREAIKRSGIFALK